MTVCIECVANALYYQSHLHRYVSSQLWLVFRSNFCSRKIEEFLFFSWMEFVSSGYRSDLIFFFLTSRHFWPGTFFSLFFPWYCMGNYNQTCSSRSKINPAANQLTFHCHYIHFQTKRTCQLKIGQANYSQEIRNKNRRIPNTKPIRWSLIRWQYAFIEMHLLWANQRNITPQGQVKLYFRHSANIQTGKPVHSLTTYAFNAMRMRREKPNKRNWIALFRTVTSNCASI